MFIPLQSHFPSRDLILGLMRDEKRRFDELLQSLEAGQLSESEAITRLKDLEKAVKCMRYGRFECGLDRAANA